MSQFMERNELSIRRKPTTGQSLPKDLVPKIVEFVIFCKKHRDLHKFPLSAIANMDETPIWADMPAQTTVSTTGTRVIPIRTTWHEKNRITVCLCAKADGTKMKPYIVVPAAKVPKDLEDMSGVVIAASKNGWMSDELTKDWINRVWRNLSFTKRFLIWDSFKCHIADAANDALKLRKLCFG